MSDFYTFYDQSCAIYWSSQSLQYYYPAYSDFETDAQSDILSGITDQQMISIIENYCSSNSPGLALYSDATDSSIRSEVNKKNNLLDATADGLNTTTIGLMRNTQRDVHTWAQEIKFKSDNLHSGK